MPSDDTLRNVPSSPHQQAAAYFRAYLAHRPSAQAQQELQEAFNLWSSAKGSSKTIAQAIKHIPLDADVWSALVPLMMQAFAQDDRYQEGFQLADKLAQAVEPLQSRSALRFAVGDYYLSMGALAEAQHAFADVFRWNAAKFLVEQAITHLFRLTGPDIGLQIGSLAPLFVTIDREGDVLDLASYEGCIVVLHFWDPAVASNGSFHHQLRRIAQDYLVHGVNLIGITPEVSLERLGEELDEDGFFWAQICDQETELQDLFAVEEWPTTYVLDREGRIMHKYVGAQGGSLLRAAVHALILGR